MHELRAMWRNTRMIVLCAISAALYAAILVPFKVVPLIPGVTELRPANAIPVVCSFLFGPAAAWGSAIGNMIGDFFGGVSPGDSFGFIGNLAYGYIPYKVWSVIAARHSPVERTWFAIACYVLVCLLASVLCADFIGFGDNVLAIRPFVLLGNVVILNNMASALVLSPFILGAVYPRVARGKMLYKDVMPELQPPHASRSFVGLALLIVGEVGAWVSGNLLSSGYWIPRFLPEWMAAAPHDKSIAVITGPFLLLAIAGLALL
jgi:energy-coupling factor transport system substrate-specific component